MNFSKTILAATLICLTGSAWAGSPAHHAPTQTQSKSKTSTDPFTGMSRRYEDISQQALTAQAEQKLVQFQFRIARYRQKLAALSRNGPNGGNGTSKKMKALEQKVNMLTSQVSSLQSQVHNAHQGHSGGPHPEPRQAMNPASGTQLIGIAQNGPANTAWLKLPNGHVVHVKTGAKVGNFKIRAIHANDVVISTHGHKHMLKISNDYGQVGINGQVAQPRSGPGGPGGPGFTPSSPAPGSTPASAQAMKSQGARTIASALNHS